MTPYENMLEQLRKAKISFTLATYPDYDDNDIIIASNDTEQTRISYSIKTGELKSVEAESFHYSE